MTPAELIAAFEVLAEAPDGVARLRDSILELAVRGRLVRQDPTDEPASAMLGRVVVELARLGKRKPVADSAPIVPVEGAPFAVPSGWVWCRLGSILVECRNGTSASPNDSQVGYPVLRISACTSRQDAVVNLEDCKFVEMPEESALPFFVEPEDLLACRYNGNLHYVGRVALVPNGHARPTLYPDKLIRLRALEVQHRYLRIAINAGPTRRQIAAVAATTAGNIGINGKQLQALMVPLPPLAEQRRIVARVEELMGLLDRLEAARTKREATRAAARDSVLAALREADSPEAVDAALTRFAQRMDELLCDPADIAPLRQTVLELAVRGRLVRQDPTDEPASAMLGRVVGELARLGKRKSVAGSDPIVPVAGAPFAVPGGWAWSRLGSILVECRNGTSASPNDSQVGYPVLRISACTSRQDAVVDLEDCKFVEMPEESALPFFVEPEDLLACRYNGNLHYVGRVALVPNGHARPTLYPDKLIRLRALEVQHRYLRIAINAGPTRRQIAAVAATTAGNIGINGKQLQALMVPLPPLAEQRRIVARVEELMALLDRLEQRLVATKATQSAFAGAAAHYVVA